MNEEGIKQRNSWEGLHQGDQVEKAPRYSSPYPVRGGKKPSGATRREILRGAKRASTIQSALRKIVSTEDEDKTMEKRRENGGAILKRLLYPGSASVECLLWGEKPKKKRLELWERWSRHLF